MTDDRRTDRPEPPHVPVRVAPLPIGTMLRRKGHLA